MKQAFWFAFQGVLVPLSIVVPLGHELPKHMPTWAAIPISGVGVMVMMVNLSWADKNARRLFDE